METFKQYLTKLAHQYGMAKEDTNQHYKPVESYKDDITVDEFIAECPDAHYLITIAKDLDCDVVEINKANLECADSVKYMMFNQRLIDGLDIANENLQNKPVTWKNYRSSPAKYAELAIRNHIAAGMCKLIYGMSGPEEYNNAFKALDRKVINYAALTACAVTDHVPAREAEFNTRSESRFNLNTAQKMVDDYKKSAIDKDKIIIDYTQTSGEISIAAHKTLVTDVCKLILRHLIVENFNKRSVTVCDVTKTETTEPEFLIKVNEIVKKRHEKLKSETEAKVSLIKEKMVKNDYGNYEVDVIDHEPDVINYEYESVGIASDEFKKFELERAIDMEMDIQDKIIKKANANIKRLRENGDALNKHILNKNLIICITPTVRYNGTMISVDEERMLYDIIEQLDKGNIVFVYKPVVTDSFPCYKTKIIKHQFSN